MAFFNTNSAIVSPLLSPDDTWTAPGKTNGLNIRSPDDRNESNKENVPPTPVLGLPLLLNDMGLSSADTMVDRFPFHDPLKIRSKAKDPIIAPPKGWRKPTPLRGSPPLRLHQSLQSSTPSVSELVMSSSVKLELVGKLNNKQQSAVESKTATTPTVDSTCRSLLRSPQTTVATSLPEQIAISSGKLEFLGKPKLWSDTDTKTATPFADAARRSLLPSVATAVAATTSPSVNLRKDKKIVEKRETAISIANFSPCEDKTTDKKRVHAIDTTNLATLHDYSRLLRSYTHGSKKDAHAAENVLRFMIHEFQEGNCVIRPDGVCFNLVIHAFAEVGDAKSAEAVLALMFEDYEQGNPQAEPNVRVYTNLLHAWRKSKARRAPERCEAILETMHRLHESGVLPRCKPDTFAYTVLFHCWAESNRSDAVDHAERLFRKMKERFHQGYQRLCPDAIAYSNLLNIFTKGSETHTRAEAILWEMVQDYLSGNQSAKPRIRNFNTVLAMWSKSKASHAPDRAHYIVLRLLGLNGSNTLDVTPDPYTYSLLLKTWYVPSLAPGSLAENPYSRSILSVLHNANRASSNRPDGVSRAVECLSWMKHRHRLGDEAARLDVIKYTTCISALSRVGHPEKAEELLMEMIADYREGNKNCQPDCKTFEVVIAAWCGLSKNTTKVDGQRAEALLHKMWSLRESGEFRSLYPNATTYKRVILAMKTNRRPDRAEELLLEMDRFHRIGKLKERPDICLYQAVITSWRESKHKDRKMREETLEATVAKRFLHSKNG